MNNFENKLSLRFKDKEVQKKWNESQSTFNKQTNLILLYSAYIFHIISLIDMQFINNTTRYQNFSMIFRAVQLVITMIGHTFNIKKYHKASLYLNLSNMLLTTLENIEFFIVTPDVSSLKLINASMEDSVILKADTIFIYGMLSVYFTISMVVQMKWMVKVYYNLAPVTYLGIRRYFDQQYLIYLPCSLIYIFVLFYEEEKNGKQNFLTDLMKTQNLVKILEKIPSGVAIMGLNQRTEKKDQDKQNLENPKQSQFNYEMKFQNNQFKEIFSQELSFLLNQEVVNEEHFLNESQDFSDQKVQIEKILQDLDSYENVPNLLMKKQGLVCSFYQMRFLRVFSQDSMAQDNILIFVTNITDTKEKDNLIHANQYKNQVLAQVSHDIKNPLSNTIQMLKFALIENNPLTSQSLLEKAINCSQFLMFLLHDILDSCQIQKSKLKLVYTKFELGTCLQSIADLFQIQAKDKNVRISIQNKNLEVQVYLNSDEVRIKQILINFILNGLKFTQNGEVKISFQIFQLNSYHPQQNEYQLSAISPTEANQVSEKYFLISIQDSGAGMNENVITNLFNQFGTFNNLSNDNQRGIGLGLMICKDLMAKIAHDIQNSIIVDSVEGMGTRFVFLVPSRDEISIPSKVHKFTDLKDVLHEKYYRFSKCSQDSEIVEENYNNEVEENKMSPIRVRKESNKFGQKLRILIVDDSSFNTFALRFLLENSKLQIECIDEVYNGDEAIEQVQSALKRKLMYDVIFLDLHMPPGMNGIQVAKHIRNLEQFNAEDTKIFLLTAESQPPEEAQIGFFDQNLQQTIDLFSSILLKPVEIDSVEQEINKVYY